MQLMKKVGVDVAQIWRKWAFVQLEKEYIITALANSFAGVGGKGTAADIANSGLLSPNKSPIRRRAPALCLVVTNLCKSKTI